MQELLQSCKAAAQRKKGMESFGEAAIEHQALLSRGMERGQQEALPSRGMERTLKNSVCYRNQQHFTAQGPSSVLSSAGTKILVFQKPTAGWQTFQGEP